MRRYIACAACVMLFCSGAAVAGDKGKSRGDEHAKSDSAQTSSGGAGGERSVSGMSIVGTDETPKSLVIVPWKSSEIGQESKLKSDLLNDSIAPVDRDVFMRQLNFYKLANPK
jgi:hypothetical protein